MQPDDLFPTETDGPDATRALGRKLALRLRRPWVIALYGVMGVGKTHFVKGLADGLGLDGDEVTSPTFTIVHEVRSGRHTLRHIDAYRVETAGDLASFDVDDLLYGTEPCVIEWPERLESLLPPDVIRIRLEHAGPSNRRFTWLEQAP